jgi:hypothetical protein
MTHHQLRYNYSIVIDPQIAVLVLEIIRKTQSPMLQLVEVFDFDTSNLDYNKLILDFHHLSSLFKRETREVIEQEQAEYKLKNAREQDTYEQHLQHDLKKSAADVFVPDNCVYDRHTERFTIKK